jgi:cobalt-zinc-cadmium resistance protein CzcA
MNLNTIIGFSIKNKLIIGLFTIGLIIYGSFELFKLPIDAVPDITNNQVQVITIAPSLGATDIERLVTFPIEQANNNIPGLHEIRSFSRFGLSLVTIVFEDDVDVYWARQQVSERIQNVKDQIPQGVCVPELGPVTTGLGEIYQYVLRPKPGFEHQYSSMELRTIQDWIVRRQLLGVKGVADVSSFGGHLKQYEIALNPDKLQSLGLTIDQVFKAIEANNENTGGGYIERGPNVFYIRTEGLVHSEQDLMNVPVKLLDNGVPLLIRDIAQVRIGTAIRYGALHLDTLGEVSGAVVMMLKGANSSEVIKAVKDRVAEIQKTLPEGIVIEPFLDRTKMVNNAIGTVETNLLEGALIVIFVLVVFLGNLRAGLLVASVIPLSMLFAIIMMNLFHVSGNLMSLGALDFGLIVDGAVIIVEAVMHALAIRTMGQMTAVSNTEMDDTVKSSAGKMMNSAVFGQIIILIVYLPIFSLQGIEGKMFKPMAQTVAFALLGAFILSLTYVPMMSAWLLSRKAHKPNWSDLFMQKVEAWYQKAFEWIVLKVKWLFIGLGLLVIAAVVVLTQLGGEFIPSLEEGDFALETRVLPGSNLNVSLKASEQASKILLTQFPEVEKVVAKIGSGEVPTDPMPIDAQDLMIIMKDKHTWKTAHSFNEMAEKMGEALKAVPGVTFGFQYPVQMRFNELMTGARQDVVCKLFGEDLDTLAYYAAKMGHLASKVEGAQDIYVEPVTGVSQIVVDYKRDLIARYGLQVAAINSVVNTAFAGGLAGKVYEGEKRFDLVLRLQNDHRKTLNDVQNLLIPIGQNNFVPLSHLADVSIKVGPNQIQREDAKRRIVVGFNVRGRDVQSIVDELKTKIEKQIKLPPGYSVRYGGTFENLNAAKKRLGIAVPLALALIFLMLYFAFQSIKHASLIYSAIPLSALGGIFALYIRDMPFSISAGVGFIALFGVAVLNGIVLISEFKRQKETHTGALTEMVMNATKLRLRPVLMTAFVASLGFLPMALSNGAGAEVQRPLATVVIGGLLIATFLTLFVLPILFIMSEQSFKMKGLSLKAIITIAFIGVGVNGFSQTTIGFKQALDSALNNNLQIKQAHQVLAYQKALNKSAVNIPKTALTFERGQLNSYYTDKRFGLNQTLSLPMVYSQQYKVLSVQTLAQSANLQLTQSEVKQRVLQAYFNWLNQAQQLLALRSVDTMFKAMLKQSSQLYSLGEIDIAQNASIQLKGQSIMAQLHVLESAQALTLSEFNWLLNTHANYTPDLSSGRMPLPNIDSSLLLKHPQLQILKQYVQLSQQQSKLESYKLLPEIQLGYSNMTMNGFGADNRFYTNSARFQSFQFGVTVPLFYNAQKAMFNASKIDRTVQEQALKIQTQALQLDWQQCLSALEHHIQYLNYFDGAGLTQLNQLKTTANLQLQSGDISYSDWVGLMGQYFELQKQYFEVVNQYNQNIIHLNYLMGQF